MSKKQLLRCSISDFGNDDSGCEIIHVDMDAFYVNAEILANPTFLSKPIIVAYNVTRGVVLSASYEVRTLGVYAGQSVAQAKQLAPNAHIVPPHHELYASISKKVMNILYDITYNVEQISIDEAFLDVSSAQKMYGTPYEIAKQIKSRIQTELKLVASVGVAQNMFLAKLASTHSKPDGLLVVPKKFVKNFLWPLPVNALWGVGEKTATRLVDLGYITIGDIATQNKRMFIKRFGKIGENLYALSHGIDERKVSTEYEEKSISNEITFPVDVQDTETILRCLHHLSVEVSSRLRKKNLRARTIGIKIRFENFRTITRSISYSVGVNSTYEIFKIVEKLFRNEHTAEKIRLLGVKASELAGDSKQIAFDEASWEDADAAVDELGQKFGNGAVIYGRLVRYPGSKEHER